MPPAQVASALDAVPTRERQCVVWRLCQRMSFEWIARDLKVPVRDVCDTLSRTKACVQTYTAHFDSDSYSPDTTGPTVQTACVLPGSAQPTDTRPRVPPRRRGTIPLGDSGSVRVVCVD
jgi:hypothetical protein